MQNRSNTFQDSQMQSTIMTTKYKLVFLGDQSVGKTSIINRFIFDTFDGKDNPTVGIDFISKTLYYDDRAVKLQLWDTAGQERFRSLIPSYIRDCSAAIVIFDCSSSASFKSVNKWIEDIRGERGNDVILVLVANKIDLGPERVVSKEEGEQRARELDALYMEVSAKTGLNITSLFQLIANNLPGNENNKLFTSEAQNVSSTNIKLEKPNHTDDEFESRQEKKCGC